jgi:hypothetical protein
LVLRELPDGLRRAAFGYRTACAVPLLFTGQLTMCRFCLPDGLRRAAFVYRTAYDVPLLVTERLPPCRFWLRQGVGR